MAHENGLSPALQSILRGLCDAGWRVRSARRRTDADGVASYLAEATREGLSLSGEGYTPFEAWATLAEVARRVDES